MKVLVGEGEKVPLPDISQGPHEEAVEICDEVIGKLQTFWKCFENHVPTITGRNGSSEEEVSSTGSSAGGSSDAIVLDGPDENGDEKRKMKKSEDDAGADEVLSDEANSTEMRMTARIRELGLVSISTPRSECSVTHTNNFQTVTRPCFVFIHNMYL
jgi:hypothetical protein